MHIKASSSQMFLQSDNLASHRCVTETKVIEISELDKTTTTSSAVTIENNFSALDTKKWRIVLTIGAYKSEDL
jgi:hypothetical protein